MTTLNQEATQLLTKTKLPSFSIIFETENLTSTELDNIYRSLASIASQDVSPKQANEFLIIDGGYASEEIINDIRSKYPWITVHQVQDISYYEAKMLGATLATGEIIIYCDSDCVYVSDWLRNILITFSQDSNLNVISGETSTPIRNIYEMAIAMHYFFPRFSTKKQPYLSKSYFLNNVAFRREFLLANPIPTSLAIYRGNCAIHYYQFCLINKNKILQHPQARAIHEPPTISFCFWRYLLMGRDFVLKERIRNIIRKNPNIEKITYSVDELNLTFSQRVIGIASALKSIRPFNKQKISDVLQEDKSRLFLLPLVIPIILWFELLFIFGRIITYIQPNLLIELYYKSEKKDNEMESSVIV